MSSNEDVYASLKQDMLCVYNTQICGVVIEEYYPYKGYPLSYSYFKRNKLEHKLYRSKNFPYALLRFFIKLISFFLVLAIILFLSYLVSDVIVGAMLGYLGAQVCILLNMIINDTIECKFEYERFSKFKKPKWKIK